MAWNVEPRSNELMPAGAARRRGVADVAAVELRVEFAVLDRAGIIGIEARKERRAFLQRDFDAEGVADALAELFLRDAAAGIGIKRSEKVDHAAEVRVQLGDQNLDVVRRRRLRRRVRHDARHRARAAEELHRSARAAHPAAARKFTQGLCACCE